MYLFVVFANTFQLQGEARSLQRVHSHRPLLGEEVLPIHPPLPTLSFGPNFEFRLAGSDVLKRAGEWILVASLVSEIIGADAEG